MWLQPRSDTFVGNSESRLIAEQLSKFLSDRIDRLKVAATRERVGIVVAQESIAKRRLVHHHVPAVLRLRDVHIATAVQTFAARNVLCL
jgi:hypothetical protein